MIILSYSYNSNTNNITGPDPRGGAEGGARAGLGEPAVHAGTLEGGGGRREARAARRAPGPPRRLAAARRPRRVAAAQGPRRPRPEPPGATGAAATRRPPRRGRGPRRGPAIGTGSAARAPAGRGGRRHRQQRGAAPRRRSVRRGSLGPWCRCCLTRSWTRTLWAPWPSRCSSGAHYYLQHLQLDV